MAPSDDANNSGERKKWSDPVVDGYKPKQVAVPVPAATLIVAAPVPEAERVPGDADFRVLMITRSSHGFFGSLSVFPGGKVDPPADGHPDWLSFLRTPPHAAQLARPLPDSHSLTYAVAAVREAFEETGTLLVEPRRASAGLSGAELASLRDGLKAARDRITKKPLEFLEFCKGAGVAPALRRVVPWSRWITPESVPKRFDTRFFLATWSQPRGLSADNFEVVGVHWYTPQEALRLAKKKEISLIMPQQKTLEELGGYTFAQLEEMTEGRKARDPKRLEAVVPGIPPAAKKEGDKAKI
ncbi:hypothetical protein DFJ74DRAFT_693124 [Hyaloraphidium curvatum]|nr:hypothetical protein DFJ74DRAFT_693124 [Hyaloraphidium curvatum]